MISLKMPMTFAKQSWWFLWLKKTINIMKFLLSNKRTNALLGIGLIAIVIGAISKKVISYPTGGCMKGTQELTLNKGIKNKIFI